MASSRWSLANGRGDGRADVKIYQKPTCSTCRQALQFIKESGKPYTAVNYYDMPFTKSQLKALLKKAKLSPKDILRTKEDIYKSLGLAKKELSDDALIELMVEYPDLIQRPIVEKGDRAILARPAETVKQLL
jgi:arsenate reductase (glutaredoxin)